MQYLKLRTQLIVCDFVRGDEAAQSKLFRVWCMLLIMRMMVMLMVMMTPMLIPIARLPWTSHLPRGDLLDLRKLELSAEVSHFLPLERGPQRNAQQGRRDEASVWVLPTITKRWCLNNVHF